MAPACSRPTACWPSTTRSTCPRKSPTPSRSRGIGRKKKARTAARAPPRRRKEEPNKGGRNEDEAAVIAELGHYALVLALGLALVQAVVPIYGARQNDAVLMSV